MVLDIIVGICVVLALIKGFSRGLVIGLFSLVAVIVGLAAAMKLSAVVAHYIGDSVNISGKWLPVISFIIVFIIVVLLIRLAANAIDRTIEIAMLGWLNKLGGMILYLIIYLTVLSVLLFYAEQIHILKPATIADSVTYQYIQPWGPKAINALGQILPFFRDMFAELQQFFEAVSEEIAPSS